MRAKIEIYDGEETIVPTGRRGRPLKNPVDPTLSKPLAKRSFYGATYLFDEIGKKLGIVDDLKYIFPKYSLTHLLIKKN